MLGQRSCCITNKKQCFESYNWTKTHLSRPQDKRDIQCSWRYNDALKEEVVKIWLNLVELFYFDINTMQRKNQDKCTDVYFSDMY